MKKISACIITKNEEKILPYCLYSLKWVDEIIIVDSGSSDKTTQIARKYGAKVFFKKWDGYVNQKNFAISKAKGDWILSIDADEIVSDDLKNEILNVINKKDKFNGYFIKSKNNYYGSFLNYGALRKDYHLRLFKNKIGKYEETYVHEVVKIKGQAGYLKNYLFHFTADNIAEHIETVNIYTEYEILNLKKNGYTPTGYSVLFKWIIIFIKNYFFKFGFLDGIKGLIFNVISSYYVLIKEVKYAQYYGFHKINFIKTLFKRAK